ncbi:hypothetical protein Pcinc_035660 [Petrolisthes cinctipes]|uniref:Uncharacterized protein n=1 Tax=Petrolisthes cinctipes TaxID=88211 RepID=A0AAE1BX89_PETCI|nr:hypothetical protein Pcinc_035660 [Petrolisthes cinctipes]
MEHRNDDYIFTTHTHTSVSDSKTVSSIDTAGSRPPTDMAQLLQFMVLDRQQADERRRRQERRENNQRLYDILQALTATTPGSPPSTNTPSSSTATLSSSTPQHKPHIQAPTPPSLKPDVSFQTFREWRRNFHHYCVMVDFSILSHDKQLIQLRMCLTL